MATDAQRLPVGDLAAARPSTEEAFLGVNAPTHATAPNALLLKGSDNVSRLIGFQMLQADGSAFPVALRPPTGEVYQFFDTNTSQVSTVDAAGTVTPVGAGSFVVIGDIDCSGNPLYPAATKGDAYRVSVAGKIGGGAGPDVQVGDIIVAWADNAGGTQAAVGADWTIEQGNIEPATSSQAIAGTDTSKYIVSSTLAAALQQSKANFALQAGADTDAIVADTVPATAVLETGRQILLRKTAGDNTGAVTLNVGTGVVSVVKTQADGTEIALVAGDLTPGDYLLTYNTSGSNRWVLTNPKNINANLVGTLTGNSTGTHTGAVTGNVTGDVTGNVAGNLNGNSTGTHAGGYNVGNAQYGIFQSGSQMHLSGDSFIHAKNDNVTGYVMLIGTTTDRYMAYNQASNSVTFANNSGADGKLNIFGKELKIGYAGDKLGFFDETVTTQKTVTNAAAPADAIDLGTALLNLNAAWTVIKQLRAALGDSAIDGLPQGHGLVNLG